jgi:DnaJ-class molecular chaperone
MAFELHLISSKVLYMTTRNPYQVLGVTQSASQEEIKNAYRNLAKKYHPDLNPGNAVAEKKFKELNQAYELIGTKEQRDQFDRGEAHDVKGERFGRRPFYYETQQEPESRYSFSFGDESNADIFDQIFGQGTAQATGKGAQAKDESYRMEIELKEAVLGVQKEITLPHGRKLSVKVPPGVVTGSKLRFAGQARPAVSGGASGDVYLEIDVKPDRRFNVQGDDLILELPISISEAVLGGEAKIQTLEAPIMLKIPLRVNTDTKLRVPGKGVYNRKLKKRGDQIVILKVFLPKDMDSELIESIKKWSERHSYNPREGVAA